MKFGLRELVFIVVLLAVPVVSMFYVFKPRNADIEQAMQEIAVKQAKLDRLASMESEIDDLDRAIIETTTIIEEVARTLPDRKGVEDVLQQIHEISKRNGLVTKSFTPDKPESDAGYMEQPIAISMEGEFDGFYQFLLELERMPRITQMRELTLARLQGRGSSGDKPGRTMKAEFVLSIYYKPDAASGAS